MDLKRSVGCSGIAAQGSHVGDLSSRRDCQGCNLGCSLLCPEWGDVYVAGACTGQTGNQYRVPVYMTFHRETLGAWLSCWQYILQCYPGILLRVETGPGIPARRRTPCILQGYYQSWFSSPENEIRSGEAWVSRRTTGRLRETPERSGPLNRQVSPYIPQNSFAHIWALTAQRLERRVEACQGPAVQICNL